VGVLVLEKQFKKEAHTFCALTFGSSKLVYKLVRVYDGGRAWSIISFPMMTTMKMMIIIIISFQLLPVVLLS